MNNDDLIKQAIGQTKTSKVNTPIMELIGKLEALGKQTQTLFMYIANLEQSVAVSSIQNQAQKFHLNMLQNILLENNLIIQEDLEKRFKEEVEDPIRDEVNKINKQREQQVSEVVKKEEENKKVISKPEEISDKEKTEEPESPIILASERFRKNN